MKKILIFILTILIIGITILCYQIIQKQKTIKAPQKIITTTTREKTFLLEEIPVDQIQIANPASQYCIENNGEIIIKKDINGGEYGVCCFKDNKQCEEWAMFRNLCPVGGLKITGYENDGQIECAIKGGEVDMNNKLCIFKNKTCDITQNYLKCK
jgi:putative hemolysin